MEITISNLLKKIEGNVLTTTLKLPATQKQIQQAFIVIQTAEVVNGVYQNYYIDPQTNRKYADRHIEEYRLFPVQFRDSPTVEQVNLFAHIYDEASNIAKSRLQSYAIRHPKLSCLECINVLLQQGIPDIHKYSYMDVALYCTLQKHI